jgi:prepilin-type N-terminal cleavage/methylation domain-containing protein
MRSQTSNLKSQTGFTLLEVVVSLAIVGLGVVTLFEVFSLGLLLVTRSAERSEAITYGRQAMDGVLIRWGVKDGEEEGTFGQRHRWRLQVKPFQDETQLSTPGWELKEMALEVWYQEVERRKKVEMKTLRLVKKDR